MWGNEFRDTLTCKDCATMTIVLFTQLKLYPLMFIIALNSSLYVKHKNLCSGWLTYDFELNILDDLHYVKSLITMFCGVYRYYYTTDFFQHKGSV